MSNDNNYIGISTAIGGLGGAVYGFRNPNEQTITKITRMKPSLVDVMQEYRDSFNYLKAGDAFREGKITEEEYKRANDIRTAFHNVYEKEKQVIDIANTPIEERTKTFRQAVKEANATRPKLWKTIIGFDKDFRNKLIELEIFDAEKFSAAFKAIKGKMLFTYKELGKFAAKGLAIGAAIGAVVGIALNKISN